MLSTILRVEFFLQLAYLVHESVVQLHVVVQVAHRVLIISCIAFREIIGFSSSTPTPDALDFDGVLYTCPDDAEFQDYGILICSYNTKSTVAEKMVFGCTVADFYQLDLLLYYCPVCFYNLTISMKPALSNKKGKRTADRSKSSYDRFDNLVTAEQERMMDASVSKPALRSRKPQGELNADSMEEEQVVDVPLEAIQQVDADKMSILVGQLLAKNVLLPNIQKINAKNAFDVPMILLHQTEAFSEAASDNSWKRLSSTLESNNKIYGYRVDAAHNYTYRVLELFTRQERLEGQEKEDDSDRRDRRDPNTSNSPFLCEDFGDCYARHLEKNLRNINIMHLESFFNVNPVLEKTKRIFDQQGLGALLLNNLDIRMDLSLRISLIQQTNFEEISTNAEENLILCELECGAPPPSGNIFKTIENTCQINNFIEENEDFYLVKRESAEIDALWMQLETECASKHKKKSVKIEQGVRMPIQIDFQNQPVLKQNCATFEPNREGLLPSALLLPQTSNFQSIFQSTNAPFLATTSLPGSSYDPFSNLSQMTLHITPSNTSHLSEDVSNAEQEPANCVQISSYIKMNKQWLSNDLVLRQLTEVDEGEGGEKADLVAKWKNEAAPKKRKIRERKPVVEASIDFLDRSDGVKVSKKHQVLNIDKKARTQFKRLLKTLKIPPYKDINCLKDWKFNFNIKALLSRCEEIKKDDNRMEIEAEEIVIDSRVVIDLQAEDERWAAKRNASIRQAKEFIKAQIDGSMEEEVSFASIYSNFREGDSLVSPALCFLTVLHLSNEHNYTLSQKGGEYNFLIRRQ